jgi:hypothetical protein
MTLTLTLCELAAAQIPIVRAIQPIVRPRDGLVSILSLPYNVHLVTKLLGRPLSRMFGVSGLFNSLFCCYSLTLT